MKRSLGPKTLAYPTPVFLVASYDAGGRANVMTAAWGGICCSKPPCVAVSLRAATYSHGCIRERGAFSVNIPAVDQVREADFFGVVSGRERDKLAEAGMSTVASELVDAPLIEQCAFALECRVAHIHELGLHTQFVGEIVDVKADPAVLDADGRVDVELLRPLLYVPGAHQYRAFGPPVAAAFQVRSLVDADQG